MKARKPKKITDEMIGEADKICACSAVVGDIIKDNNEAKKKSSLKEILAAIEDKTEKDR